MMMDMDDGGHIPAHLHCIASIFVVDDNHVDFYGNKHRRKRFGILNVQTEEDWSQQEETAQ